MPETGQHPHSHEPHTRDSVAARLNWLRAGVLGANDGIVSTAGLVVGVAAATSDKTTIATAGFAGLTAGAISMALGEYVSVSTQRDTERALVRKERRELELMPEAERQELVELLRRRGLSTATSELVADELSAGDPLAAHLELELGLRREDIVNPWAAAASSAVSFVAGALLPIVAVLLPPVSARVPVVAIAVLLALVLTGAISAHLGQSPKGPAIARLVIGGAIALAVTYVVGELLGVAVT